MMTASQFSLTRSLRHGLVLLAVACALSTVFAADLVTTVDQPVAISGQIFEAGRVEIAPSAQGNLQAVLVNGRQVALVFRHAVDRLPAGANATLMFRYDEQDVAHLVGLEWTDPRTGYQQRRLFRIAAVSPGPRAVARRVAGTSGS